MATCGTVLKEWAVLVEALKSGDQIYLLRKGGIADHGGEFELAASRFWLWPTYLHQSPDWLAGSGHHRLAEVMAPRAADAYRLDAVAEVHEVLTVPSRESLDSLADEHIWSPGYLDLRWRYRPELPLYLLVLRVALSERAHTVVESVTQRGCKSWVDLGELPTGKLRPAVETEIFQRRAEAIVSRLGVRSSPPTHAAGRRC